MLSAMSGMVAWDKIFLLFNAEECPALCGTAKKALSGVKVAIGLWIGTAREEGREHLTDILAGRDATREQMA